MSESETSQARHSVPEATAEDGRSFVLPSSRPKHSTPKFRPGQEAWLKDERGGPGSEVIIGLCDNQAGRWKYTLKYKDTREPVYRDISKPVLGGDWFSQRELDRRKPY